VLIDDLKKDHVDIVNTLTKVKELGITTKEGQARLLAAKEGLLAHLKKEDEQLYPYLRKEAETDGGLKNLLETFAKDMDGISKAALDFFAKYASGGSNVEFAKDFGGLTAALSKRIRQEENLLYPEYSKRKG